MSVQALLACLLDGKGREGKRKSKGARALAIHGDQWVDGVSRGRQRELRMRAGGVYCLSVWREGSRVRSAFRNQDGRRKQKWRALRGLVLVCSKHRYMYMYKERCCATVLRIDHSLPVVLRGTSLCTVGEVPYRGMRLVGTYPDAYIRGWRLVIHEAYRWVRDFSLI